MKRRKFKLKIAVAFDEEGYWHAAGWGPNAEAEEPDMMNVAIDALGPGRRQVYATWINAEVEVDEKYFRGGDK